MECKMLLISKLYVVRRCTVRTGKTNSTSKLSCGMIESRTLGTDEQAYWPLQKAVALLKALGRNSSHLRSFLIFQRPSACVPVIILPSARGDVLLVGSEPPLPTEVRHTRYTLARGANGGSVAPAAGPSVADNNVDQRSLQAAGSSISPTTALISISNIGCRPPIAYAPTTGCSTASRFARLWIRPAPFRF